MGTLASGARRNSRSIPRGSPGVKVEYWQRTIKIPPPGSVPPPPASQKLVRSHSSSHNRGRECPCRTLSVRLYEEGKGNPAGDGPVLSKLNFPCVLSDTGRSNFLTKCTEVPQLDIAVGGTFVSLAIAASKLTMSRARLAKAPANQPGRVAAVLRQAVVANALSESTGPKLLQGSH